MSRLFIILSILASISFLQDELRFLNKLNEPSFFKSDKNLMELSGPNYSKSPIRAKDFAKGDTLEFYDGSIESGSSTLRSPTVAFRTTDVGKYILVNRAGVAGQSVLGKIISVITEHSVRLSFKAEATAASIKFIYGNDDTADVGRAVSLAQKIGTCVDFDEGGYWLVTQSSSIILNYVCMRGSGSRVFSPPYLGHGSTIIITNDSASPFMLQNGVGVYGLQFYYPMQDGSQSTPIKYPALFTGINWANDTFFDNVFINPFDLFEAQSAGTFGRITISANKAYCIHYCFNLKAGNADQLQIDSNNIFSPGIYEGVAIYGNEGALAAWTGEQGEFIHFDATGAAFSELSVNMNGGLVYGYRYGIRAVNQGDLYVSTIQNVSWDGVSTVLSFEGSTYPAQVSLIGGYVWSYRGRSNSANKSADPVLNVASTCNGSGIEIGDLVISSVMFSNSKGSIGIFKTNCMKSIKIVANTLRNWGQSSTPALYHGLVFDGPDVDVVGNTFSLATVGENSYQCILSSSKGSIIGNVFDGCKNGVLNWQGAGPMLLTGNSAIHGKLAPIQGSGSGLQESGNFWDVELTAPTILCGSGAHILTGSSDTRGTIVTGSNAKSCNISFAYKHSKEPHCLISPRSAASIFMTTGGPTRDGFAVTLPDGISMFDYECID